MNICIFCGSKMGKEKYEIFVDQLASSLAYAGHDLVYGGASIGLMGKLADTFLAGGNKVYGVIPKSLMEWEVGHSGITKLEIVDSMHLRKQRMYELADVFLALPGGLGTLDELFEISTWRQLKEHDKPIYVLNFNGFYDHLKAHLESINAEGFVSDEHLKIIQFVDSIEDFLAKL